MCSALLFPHTPVMVASGGLFPSREGTDHFPLWCLWVVGKQHPVLAVLQAPCKANEVSSILAHESTPGQTVLPRFKTLDVLCTHPQGSVATDYFSHLQLRKLRPRRLEPLTCPKLGAGTRMWDEGLLVLFHTRDSRTLTCFQ